jgi:gluconate 2-dehydrogenase alpha chain
VADLPSRVPHVLGNTALDRFDAVVVGSGAGGAPVAWLLARHGLRVCVLEAGPNYFQGLDDPAPGNPRPLFSSDELKLEARGLIDQQVRVEPRSFRSSEADGPRSWVGKVNNLPKTVGGAFVHADCKTPRFQEFDFRIGSLLGQIPGASFADWPLDYAELEPFYAAAERLIGVQGLAGADPHAAWRSGAYPMPPGPDMYVASVLAAGARKLGLQPFPYPGAITSRDYRGRPPCNDCGFCSGFGCPINAKGSPAVTYLRDALLTGNLQLRSEATATRVLLAEGGRRAIGVSYLDPSGRPAEVHGDRVVLAASPIESARLCLLSDPGGGGLGNSSGLVGRNLMFHHQTVAIGVYRERFHGERGRSVTSGITDFRGVPGDRERPLGGIIEFGTSSRKVSDEVVSSLVSLRLRGERLRRWLQASPLGARNAALIMQGEDAPQLTNRVDLDPQVRDIHGLPVPRITYRAHAFELEARRFYGPKLLALHEAAGAQFAFVAPPFDGNQAPVSSHVLGTLRMGRDPKASVTDAFSRFHDVENLYATDGSVLPTSSGYNPTLTLQALALRAAGAMLDPKSPRSAVERAEALLAAG